jgi:alpha-L-arabinofuranosidase
VRMTKIAQMINVLQAMILTDGPRMVLTPTYHVFHMFIPFQDATLLPTDLAVQRYALGKFSVPAVSVSAARTRTGSLIVALVNLHPAPMSGATLEGGKLSVTLPAKSLVVVQLD